MGKKSGPLFLTGAFTLAGTSVVAARYVSGSLGTFTITAISLLFALLCLLPFCGKRLVEAVGSMRLKNWLPLFMQAVFGIFLFRLFLLQGLLRTSTGESGILTGATPAITALLSFLILKEPLYKSRVAGLFITIMGVLLVQGIFLPDIMPAAGHLVGNLLVLCAAACESLFNVLSRFSSVKNSVAKRMEADPLLQTTFVSFLALLICFIPALLENPLQPLVELNAGQWVALAWYGAVVTALAFFFWYAGIKRCEASVAAIFSGMMPFTALLLSVVLLGERPVWQQYLGGLLVMTGMVVSGFRSVAKKAVAEENRPEAGIDEAEEIGPEAVNS